MSALFICCNFSRIELWVQGASDAGNESLQVICHDRQGAVKEPDADHSVTPIQSGVPLELPAWQAHAAPPHHTQMRQAVKDSVAYICLGLTTGRLINIVARP